MKCHHFLFFHTLISSLCELYKIESCQVIMNNKVYISIYCVCVHSFYYVSCVMMNIYVKYLPLNELNYYSDNISFRFF